MEDLIKRSDAIDVIEITPFEDYGDYIRAKEIIENLPTIEPSIDIVFCKECVWRKEDKSCDLNCRIDYLDGTESDMWFYVKDDDFCSYGEREMRDERNDRL